VVISNPLLGVFMPEACLAFLPLPTPKTDDPNQTRNAWRPRKHWRSAHHLRRPTASTTPVASITTPIDLTANAIASAAFTSPTGMPPTRPHTISSTSPPPSPQGESGTTLLYGASGATTSNTRHNSKRNETPQPTPVGKAGFEAWVLSMGGVVSVHHCRPYRTVRSHHL
jgi:hypothetical protein